MYSAAITLLCFISPGAITGAQDPLSAQEMRYLALETEIALSNNAQIGHYPFKVEPQEGMIVLTGEVPDNATRMAAERIARYSLRNYHVEVLNKIRVIVPEAEPAPPGKPTPFDKEQMSKVRDLIDDGFPEIAENISVSFDTQPMPTIVLEGLIPSYDQKLELSRFMRKNFRDFPVLNNLKVRRVYEGDKSFYVAGSGDGGSVTRVVEPRRRNRNGAAAPEQRPVEQTTAVVKPADAQVGKQLGATLKADPVIKNCNIEVRVDDGVAWLAGQVESPGQKVRAIRLASVQPGVRYVVNQLEIRPLAKEEPSVIKVKNPDPDDLVIYVQRYLTTRITDFEDADVQIVDGQMNVTLPAYSQLSDDELRDAEARLKRMPELEEYSVRVQVERKEDGGQDRR